MKLLHIADLHAGKTLGKVSRNPDLVYALDQVVDFARENEPDLVLVAGDVFDKANPDNESKEIIFDFFLRLRDLKREVVVIAGNHDSYDFMKSISGLSRLANVHIYDRPHPQKGVFVKGELGVACLPYPSERVITSADEDAKKSYADKVSSFIRHLADSISCSRYRVLLAHLFVAGAVYTRTEKEATITMHYAVPPTALLEEFNYVALGHVHKYQRIEDAPTYAYYTGSMYQLDFSEEGQDKFFNFIHLGEGTPKVEAVKLSIKNPLKVIRLRQDEILSTLDHIKEEDGYLKVVVEVKDRTTLPQTIDKLRTTLGDKLLRLEQLWSDLEDRDSRKSLKGLDPVGIYREYFKRAHGSDLPEELEKKFVELLHEVQNKL